MCLWVCMPDGDGVNEGQLCWCFHRKMKILARVCVFVCGKNDITQHKSNNVIISHLNASRATFDHTTIITARAEHSMRCGHYILCTKSQSQSIGRKERVSFLSARKVTSLTSHQDLRHTTWTHTWNRVIGGWEIWDKQIPIFAQEIGRILAKLFMGKRLDKTLSNDCAKSDIKRKRLYECTIFKTNRPQPLARCWTQLYWHAGQCARPTLNCIPIVGRRLRLSAKVSNSPWNLEPKGTQNIY